MRRSLIAGRDYCANRGDCLYRRRDPARNSPKACPTPSHTGRPSSRRRPMAALYGPWIVGHRPDRASATTRRTHPAGRPRRWASTPASTQPRGIWKAPAGDEANLLGALDVEYRLTDTDHTDLVETRQRQRRPRRAGRRHRRRRLAHAVHRHALALRQRPAAVQLREEQPADGPALGAAGAQPRHACGTRSKFGTVTPFLHGALAAGRLRHRDAGADLHRHLRRHQQPARPGRSGHPDGRGLLLPVQARPRRSSSSSASSRAAPPAPKR